MESHFQGIKGLSAALTDWSPIILLFFAGGVIIVLFLKGKERFIKCFPMLLVFFIGLSIGCLRGSEWLTYDRKIAKGYEIRQSGYKFINPLLECEVTRDETESRELRPFKHKVQKLIDEKIRNKKAQHISVYFRELNDGPWFGINEKEGFSPASLLKVPIMMAVLKQAESDLQILDKQVKYEGGYDLNAGENIKPSKAIEAGKTYTIEELLHMMIVHSDNNASKLLVSNINMAVLGKVHLDLGINIPGGRGVEDFLPVRSYASFFRILFNASYLSKEMSEKALEYLSNVEFKAGLVAGVPPDIPVAHKFGERLIIDVQNPNSSVRQLHDCGIVYYPKSPYLLCIMSRGYDFATLDDDIREISSLVYQEVNHQMAK